MKLIACSVVALAVGSVVAAAQAQDKVLTAVVTVKTVGSTTAVHGKVADQKQGDFLFCIDQDRSAGAQAVNFTGPARVIYRPMPIAGLPPGVVITGPETVASALTVIADSGASWVFVRKGQQALMPSGAPAPVSPTTIGASIVRRLDWAASAGPRRGTDLAGCLAPAG